MYDIIFYERNTITYLSNKLASAVKQNKEIKSFQIVYSFLHFLRCLVLHKIKRYK